MKGADNKSLDLGQNFFYQLIYKPSYCNFLESRKKKKNYFKNYLYILSSHSEYHLFS